MTRHSLRFRIVAAFVIFAFVLGLLYAVFIMGSLHWSEDAVQQRRVKMEAEEFIAEFAEDDTVAMPSSRYISSGWGAASFDQSIQAYLVDLPFGVTEFNDDQFDAQVGKFAVPGRDEPLILVYEVADFEPWDTFDNFFPWLLVLGVLVVTLCGWLLGLMTARRVISPLVSLARQVERQGPDLLPTAYAVANTDDEVGILANALAASNQRVADFVQRERQFTANASHELRTPVTVVKGAAELIRSLSTDDKILTPLTRLDRGVKEMEHLIDTFLTLAREGNLENAAEAVDVQQVVRQVVAESRHLLEGKSVQLSFQMIAALHVDAPEAVVRIVAGNLIRNAFSYTKQGEVTLSVDRSALRIEDTGPGFPENRIGSDGEPLNLHQQADGHGLGLGIVNDFCRRYGWQLVLANRPGTGSCVEVIFHHDENPYGG